MLENDLHQLPEDKRVLLRSAINRIRDIANSLVERKNISDNFSNNKSNADTKKEVHLISGLIESLLTEKRVQFRSLLGVDIEGHIGTDSYGLFANIDANEFKRLLSNLINNAVEAIGEKGKVDLYLTGNPNEINIQICDNGKGIPAHLLPKIGVRGESFGKSGGMGLGLFHAKSTIKSWGGTLKIDSIQGQGVSVSLILPRMTAPNWFAPIIEIKRGHSIVILDDDSSIHQIWRGRFDGLNFLAQGISVFHFSTPNDVQKWFIETTSDPKETLFLMDYELIGSKSSGLDLIEALGIADTSILVTSRFEERGILDRCKNIGLKLIPKGAASLVPIVIKAP
jgi:hypothetical protein